MSELPDMDAVFCAVARYFSLLSDPMRLRIMHTVCNAELSVGEIVLRTGGTQSNVSRHLRTMHDCGALARRREGTLVYYRVADQALVDMCRGVCERVTAELDGVHRIRRGPA